MSVKVWLSLPCLPVVCKYIGLNVQDFNLSRSPILMPVSRTYMTGSKELWGGNIAGKSVSATSRLLCRSQALSHSEVNHFHASWNQTLLKSLNVFYPSKSLYFIQFHTFRGYVTILLLASHKFLKLNKFW